VNTSKSSVRLSHQRLEPATPASASPRSLLRFQRFRDAVAADFARVHQVRDYARHLGYSEKSLTRSTLELAGVSAKAFVSQRIALEAKRLLAHTSLPVSVIAAQLGMDEANNFAKFFKREVGCTPTEFRRQQGE
jgi:AraC-like DNA-binding protein